MHIFSDIGEVRALLALILTVAMIAFVFMGMLEGRDLVSPFATILGFYFASRLTEVLNGVDKTIIARPYIPTDDKPLDKKTPVDVESTGASNLTKGDTNGR
jgi:hypothetical protein